MKAKNRNGTDTNIFSNGASLEVVRCDPRELSISELNERKTVENIKPLVNSVKKQGIIQPPIVRPADDDYEVVVGQRRVLAARKAGLDKVTCVVTEWDDPQALLSSITENVDAFAETVSRKDRAKAMIKLKEETDMTYDEIAEEIGVGPSTVRKWMERARDEWEGTALHPEDDARESRESCETEVEVRETPSLIDDFEDDEDDSEEWRGINNRQERLREAVSSEVLDRLDDESLINIRQMTGGGESGEEVALKIVRKDLSQQDVREVRELVEHGEDVYEAVDRVAERKHEEAEEKVHVSATFEGETAMKLQERAEQEGKTVNEFTKDIVEREVA